MARLAAAARVHAGNVPTVQIIAEPDAEALIKSKEEAKIAEPPAKEPSKPAEVKEEIAKPKDKTRPVSSTPVAGTPWYSTNSLVSLLRIIFKLY